LDGLKDVIAKLTDTTEFDREGAKLQNELEVTAELLRKCVEENANTALNQEEYQKKYTTLAERFETAKTALREIDDKKLEYTVKREKVTAFMRELESRYGLIAEFDEELWNGTVESVTVSLEHKITFQFKDGYNFIKMFL
jgi:chromosome segregation ATPase